MRINYMYSFISAWRQPHHSLTSCSGGSSGSYVTSMLYLPDEDRTFDKDLWRIGYAA